MGVAARVCGPKPQGFNTPRGYLVCYVFCGRKSTPAGEVPILTPVGARSSANSSANPLDSWRWRESRKWRFRFVGRGPHAASWAISQALTEPTFQAVTRSDSLIGFGKVPAFTLRHKVGALNGSGAVLVGRLALWTSCASRTYALSGSASNAARLTTVRF